jgi:hypothetical protein
LFALVEFDLTVWHGWLVIQIVFVVTHLPLMHFVKVELDSICAPAPAKLSSYTVNIAATKMVMNIITK